MVKCFAAFTCLWQKLQSDVSLLFTWSLWQSVDAQVLIAGKVIDPLCAASVDWTWHVLHSTSTLVEWVA
jgi:hypothetical protein